MKYLVLQNDVSDLKATTGFHNSVSYTVSVTLCCAAIALAGENMRIHSQGDSHQEKIDEHDKRLAVVEDKVSSIFFYLSMFSLSFVNFSIHGLPSG
jgi:hypothetical protein